MNQPRPDTLRVARWEAERHAAVLADAPDLRHAQLLAAVAGAGALLAGYRGWAGRLMPAP